MNVSKYIFLILSVFYINDTYGQLTINVDQIPDNTPEGSSIYIAGDFQGWDPADPTYALIQTGDIFSITIDPTPGTLTFKFSRGSWGTVEGNQTGGFLPDRVYEYDGTEQTVSLQILSWEDTGGPSSTAAYNVQIIDTDFYMPQLDRNRRIWLYLPPDYDSSVEKYYPVMYMHDAQNLFDNATSFSGEWEVDETLNSLFDQGDYGCIVVGIDNGGEFRLDEYSPWINTNYGGGQGEEYVQFIVNTLKPFIDQEFRTLPQREFTGVMGSSMGGLISLYAGIAYEGSFGKIGSFSPSYWFSDEAIPYVQNSSHELPQRVYSIAGQPEGNQMVNDVLDMESALLESGFTAAELSTTIHSDGAHSEWYWAREFGDAYLWLFQDVELSIQNLEVDSLYILYPNPNTGLVSLSNAVDFTSFSLSDSQGKTVELAHPENNQLDFSHLAPGLYLLKAAKVNGTHTVFKIEKD